MILSITWSEHTCTLLDLPSCHTSPFTLPQVERSKALLASLGSERERWNASSETFKSQMSTISGDVLLTSAFMAYGGYFDQQMRQNLFSSWASHMGQANISYRADLARVEVSWLGGNLFTRQLGWVPSCIFILADCEGPRECR